MGTASPASANHVLQPACDSLRISHLEAQTALSNANQNLAAAETGLANAATNLGNAAGQLILPTFNLLKAHEDNVGVTTAQTSFNAALSFFNSAVDNYVAALVLRTQLLAARDVNIHIVPFLAEVILLLHNVEFFDCPPFIELFPPVP